MTESVETAITRDQAVALVGKHLLVALEDVIAAHEAVLSDETSTEVQKGNARRVIEAVKTIGAPLFHVVRVVERPRILRPERSIRVVR